MFIVYRSQFPVHKLNLAGRYYLVPAASPESSRSTGWWRKVGEARLSWCAGGKKCKSRGKIQLAVLKSWWYKVGEVWPGWLSGGKKGEWWVVNGQWWIQLKAKSWKPKANTENSCKLQAISCERIQLRGLPFRGHLNQKLETLHSNYSEVSIKSGFRIKELRT